MQTNVLEYFENGALLSCPEKVAVREVNVNYTFRQLEKLSKNVAALIVKRNVGTRRPIAVFLPKGVQTIAADLGIVYSGNMYANLDVDSPPQRLKAILENLCAPVLITCAQYVSRLHGLEVSDEELLLVEDAFVAEMLYDNKRLLEVAYSGIDTDPLCIIHTSGSTGVPKGVALNHRSTIDFMDWAFERLRLDGGEVIGSLSPFHFDIYTLELFFCVAKGATLVSIPQQHAAFPAKLVEFLAKHNITFIFWVPTIMVNIANQGLLNHWKLDHLKRVLFAGEVFPMKHLNYWRRCLPGAMFVNLYGPIEITVDCTYFIVDREMADDEKLPIGFPCRNTDVLILNDQNQAAKVDEPGELCVRGSSLALGYWNNPERTARAFVQNPLNSHYPELIYRTGDFVYKNRDGEIMFIGRKDFQVKHLGYRIELGEIEHAALKMNGIRNCCVCYNTNKKEIVLFYDGDVDLDHSLVRQGLATTLPKYMLPTAFRRLDLMPHNANGKIDRALLANMAQH